MTPISVPTTQAIVDAGHLDDLKLAASKMLGAERRAFQAAMALKYGAGSARQAEGVFGWSRRAVERGRHKKRTGIICLSAHSAFAGDKLWEEKHPDVADAQWALAESHSQQDPSFRSTLSFTRLTAAEALKPLRTQGFAEEGPPSASMMAEVLNRNGYRLRPVLKAKPQKKVPETDTLFAHIHDKDQASEGPMVVRLSMDCNATVRIGEYCRGGKTRGDNKANDHDRGCKEQSTPFGGVNEDTTELRLTFGRSAKTRDFIVDCLYSWWERPSPEQRDALSLLQIKADNGPQSKDRRAQFLKRMAEFADHIGTPIQLLYSPPYHSQYHPVERCWGILQRHWNGAKRVNTQTMLEWAKSMIWKGIHPVVEWSHQLYGKGISLSKEAMQAVEAWLERHPELPKWDILIRSTCVG